MYTDINFKSKKAVKDAIAAGKKITVYQPGVGNPPGPNDTVDLCGPHFPEAHKWYGTGKLQDGYLISIK